MITSLNENLIFYDRQDAGIKLANKIADLQFKDVIVVALPRGGVPVAKPIADKLKAQIDIMVAKKIGAPGNPEFAIGAVTSHGDYIISSYFEEEVNDNLDYIKEKAQELISECKLREKQYKENLNISISLNHPFSSKTILLVDDGTATGMTALAAIKSIKRQKPKKLIMAIPVISKEAYEEISSQIDQLIPLKIPDSFIAVGAHYTNFTPVTDNDIKNLLCGDL